jgi:hypothetical protein
MGKKTESAVKVTKRGKSPKADLLHVSKSVKIMAAFAELRGINKRALIQIMGEAEASYKANGRLVFGN